MAKLDKFETDIESSFDKGEWKSVKNLSTEKKKYQQMAKLTLKKEKRINIRISEKDLEDIQRKAVLEGLPYQALISSIIHKYNNGLLRESR
ncbi:MAG TPA: antitoxin [Spirochaetota bacterium]|nr:antitoxin [Spirochaetota bacterium]HOR44998.1 antitoxin [Spirochaetota bacterium]HPK56675.1 antitoxin [Spirochaetota bacterium]